MVKRTEDMTGVPPSRKVRFTCKKYTSKLAVVAIDNLANIVKQEIQFGNSRYNLQVLQGIADFLQNTNLHDFEGRGAKESFSKTELETALSYEDEALQLHYLVYRYKFATYPARKTVNDFPIVLAIEPTSLCNLKCIMCFQADRRFFGDTSLMGFMDIGLYKQIIDEAAENQPCSIVLASRGEPTLHKNFAEMVRYATTKGIIDVKINTNATRLTDQGIHELLEAEPTTLVFSVDAGDKKEFELIRVGANFDKVVSNIKRFNEIRKQDFPNSRTRTRISMTIFRETQDVKMAESLWAPLVDEFAFQSADYRLDIYDHPILPEETNPCNLLWERLYVWWDGKVNPCDIDYRSCLCLGKIEKNNSIKSLWLGEKMNALRASHSNGMKNSNYPCSQCYGG